MYCEFANTVFILATLLSYDISYHCFKGNDFLLLMTKNIFQAKLRRQNMVKKF